MLFVQNVNGDQTAFKADNVQITDTLGQDGAESKSVNMQEIYARFDDYKERLLPQLPGMAKKASKTLVSIGSGLSYIVGVLIFIITPAILYLLGSSW